MEPTIINIFKSGSRKTLLKTTASTLNSELLLVLLLRLTVAQSIWIMALYILMLSTYSGSIPDGLLLIKLDTIRIRLLCYALLVHITEPYLKNVSPRVFNQVVMETMLRYSTRLLKFIRRPRNPLKWTQMILEKNQSPSKDKKTNQADRYVA